MTPIELMDCYDADDADSIVQYALFDELVFS
jgi:23S rRNA C2498 (ribose-2'-O)-methylase RlmM